MKKLFRKIISVSLALVMTLTCLQIGKLRVEATANFTPRKTEPSVTDKHWIHTSYGGLNECMIINGDSCLPNCVGYAWGRAYEILGTKPNLSRGDAGGWYGYNISNNCYAYGSTPKLGAIACWGSHVAVVEEIYSDGKVLLSQSHYGGKRFDPVVTYPPTYTSNFQGYIYIGEFNTPNYNYSPITPGNYFIISQSDGKSLTLANNEDWNTNNIHMYETMWNNRGQHMEISQAPDGYKIRPIDSTRLVNPYGDYAAEGQNINIYADVNDSSQWWKFEKVGEGYVIHNAQNPNLVIDNADSSEAKLWTFNNGSNQKWLLIPAAAPDAPVIKGVKSSYEQSEAIIVDWDATYNTDCYDIGVAKYENGDYKWMFWQGNVTPKFNVSAAAELGAGDYRMRLESVNTKISLGGGNVYLSTVGEYVYFSIKENAAAPTIRINNTSTAVGKQVKIPVYIDNAKISSLAFTVKFDPQVLKYVSVNEMAFGNYDVNTGSASTGSVRLACFNEGSAVSGKIVVLNFEVIAKKACNTRVGIHNSEAYDNQDKAVTLKETEVDISIGASSILGDVNNDGKTNIIDARWLLQAASGSRKLTEAQKAVADVNKDGKINVIDARWMLQVASGSRKL